MPYIEMLSKNEMDIVSLGRTTKNFNTTLGDYIQVDVLHNGRIKHSLYSNRILLQHRNTGKLHLGDYHYHADSPVMGFCTGTKHNRESFTQLVPIPKNGDINQELNVNTEYKKQVNIYQDDLNRIYIKPNEILKMIGSQRGKYSLAIHFRRDVRANLGTLLKIMNPNYIENGNFFAGLEATQAGDLDNSSGKNDIIRMNNPGFSKFVLSQNGLPGNEYVMRVTGIKPNKKYVFSCWVAWDYDWDGGKQIADFTTVSSQSTQDNPKVGLPPTQNTNLGGSYTLDENDSVLMEKIVNGLTWKKLYSFVTTDALADLGSILIHLGRGNQYFLPTTNPISKRYFTDLRFEEVESFDGVVVGNYLQNLIHESNMVPLLKESTRVITNRQVVIDDVHYNLDAVQRSIPVYSKRDLQEIQNIEQNLLNIDITKVLQEGFYGLGNENLNPPSSNSTNQENAGYKKGGKVKKGKYVRRGKIKK